MRKTPEAAAIIGRVKDILDSRPDLTFSMSDLIRDVAPHTPLQPYSVNTILRAAAGDELRGYAITGEPRPGKGFSAGKMVRPLIWRAPRSTQDDDLLRPAPITLETLATRVAALETAVAQLRIAALETQLTRKEPL